jgi:5-methylcytosine-specific restriction protein A
MAENNAHRNPPWARDELILALDLYFDHRPTSISKTHPAVVALSKVLNDLPIHGDRPDALRFRNPNGVYMKLCNFLRCDPTYNGTGLQRGAQAEEGVWNEFAGNRALLKRTADAIRTGASAPEVSKQEERAADEEEEEFPEGKVLYRLHHARERSVGLREKAKAAALEKKGCLACAACGLDFHAKYGEVGRGYIECHHTIPVSELQPDSTTKLKDVVLLCPNCHRMVHRRRPWLSVKELGLLLADAAKA